MRDQPPECRAPRRGGERGSRLFARDNTPDRSSALKLKIARLAATERQMRRQVPIGASQTNGERFDIRHKRFPREIQQGEVDIRAALLAPGSVSAGPVPQG